MQSAIRMCNKNRIVPSLIVVAPELCLCSGHTLSRPLQAFANVVLALCDASDTVALFVPYYFNHLMAFQMTGITNILLGPSDPETFYPDLGVHHPHSVLERICVLLLRLSFSSFSKLTVSL